MEVTYRESRRPSTTIINTDDFDAEVEKSLINSNMGFCPDVNQRTYIAEPGIVCEQDVQVTLRDGTKICDSKLMFRTMPFPTDTLKCNMLDRFRQISPRIR
jgi:hypothetical protein